jgi:hypothetical protein
VILTDPRDRKFIVADLNSGKIENVGRQGNGPGEWASAVQIMPLSGDSSIQTSFDRRWLLLDGPKIVATMPPDSPVILATRGFTRGADGLGNVTTTAAPPSKPGETRRTERDSVALVRVSRASGRADTVAMLRDAPMVQTLRMNDSGKVISSSASRPAFSVGEEAALFTDGWIAIARLEPYRVDWRAPDGRIVRGAPLPVPVVKLDEREKKAYLDRNAKNIADMQKARPDLRALMERTYTEFPATIPPFRPFPLVAGGDGRLFIQRTVTADHPETRSDVVNRRGILEGQIALAKNERIVTVSAKSVYVVWKDDDDIERLRRHPWP